MIAKADATNLKYLKQFREKQPETVNCPHVETNIYLS